MASVPPQFTSTEISHWKDGSATITHKNASDPSKNISYGVADLAGVHKGLEENLRRVARSGTAATLDPDH